MTIDQNQTPVEGHDSVPATEQAPDTLAETPGTAAASDAAGTDAPATPSTDTPEPAATPETTAADPVAESSPEAAEAAVVAVEETPATTIDSSIVAEPVVAEPIAKEPVALHVPVAEVPAADIVAEVPSESAPEAQIEAVAVPEVPVSVVPVPVVPVEVVPVAVVSAVEAVQSAEPEGPVVSVANDLDLFEQFLKSDSSGDSAATDSYGGSARLMRGEKVEATVIQVEKNRVLVDLGTKTEGIIRLEDLSSEALESAEGAVVVGQKIKVVVLKPGNGSDGPIVSKKEADFEEVWDRIERAHQTQETVNATVVDRVKGGLVVDVGVRGFVPATHVGSGKLRNIEKFVGQVLHLKVIEIDRERKKVVLSNRQAEEESKQAAKEAIFTNAKVNDVLEGTVRRLADYGAFVDLGGVDGLLHISEMSWARINHPREMFKEGQKIKVVILRLEPEKGKISLGHRQVLPDPWNLIRERYRRGQRLTINISRIVQSGAFIKLPEGAEAFMPLSEMSIRRIKRPQDVVEEGQEVEAEIIDLRTEDRRMVLSMRAIGGGAELRPGAEVSDDGGLRSSGGSKGRGRRDNNFDDDAAGRRGFSTGGATIGERLGLLKGLLNREPSEEPETPES